MACIHCPCRKRYTEIIGKSLHSLSVLKWRRGVGELCINQPQDSKERDMVGGIKAKVTLEKKRTLFNKVKGRYQTDKGTLVTTIRR